MTRLEYNALYQALETYTDAWEAYVAKLYAEGKPDPALGICITDAKQKLIELIRTEFPRTEFFTRKVGLSPTESGIMRVESEKHRKKLIAKGYEFTQDNPLDGWRLWDNSDG